MSYMIEKYPIDVNSLFFCHYAQYSIDFLFILTFATISIEFYIYIVINSIRENYFRKLLKPWWISKRRELLLYKQVQRTLLYNKKNISFSTNV